MTKNAKTPDPIDIHVGSRIRLARTALSMSQEKLGEAVEVTFQQIQKYEKGFNRVGASRLQKISAVLNRPVEFFFGGLDTAGAPLPADDTTAFIYSKDGIKLAQAFAQVKDPEARRGLVNAYVRAAQLASGISDQAEPADHLHQRQPVSASTSVTH